MDLLSTLPSDVGQTRLLESMYFIGVTRDSAWDLTLYSDLMEDSAAWRRIQHGRKAATEPAELDLMLELCPPVATPPSSVRVYSWPGRKTQNDADIRAYAEVREHFLGFLTRWAPGADSRFANLP